MKFTGRSDIQLSAKQCALVIEMQSVTLDSIDRLISLTTIGMTPEQAIREVREYVRKSLVDSARMLNVDVEE